MFVGMINPKAVSAPALAMVMTAFARIDGVIADTIPGFDESEGVTMLAYFVPDDDRPET